jgi:hypothetical protein
LYQSIPQGGLPGTLLLGGGPVTLTADLPTLDAMPATPRTALTDLGNCCGRVNLQIPLKGTTDVKAVGFLVNSSINISLPMASPEAVRHVCH